MTNKATDTRRKAKNALGTGVAAGLGTAFFFAIIGVFGLLAAIVSLVVYVGLALLICWVQQGRGGTR